MRINKDYWNREFNLMVVLKEVHENTVIIEKIPAFGYRGKGEKVELTKREFELLFLQK